MPDFALITSESALMESFDRLEALMYTKMRAFTVYRGRSVRADTWSFALRRGLMYIIRTSLASTPMPTAISALRAGYAALISSYAANKYDHVPDAITEDLPEKNKKWIGKQLYQLKSFYFGDHRAVVEGVVAYLENAAERLRKDE